MRNLRVMRRADDMPLYAMVTRVRSEGHGPRYEIIIKFVASKRVMHKEQLNLPDKAAVQRFFTREFPTLIWGEPKYPKPRIKIVRQPKKTKPHVKPKRKRAKNPTRKLTRKSDQHSGDSGAALNPRGRRHVARRPVVRKGTGEQAVE
jgi:hypothetical protein